MVDRIVVLRVRCVQNVMAGGMAGGRKVSCVCTWTTYKFFYTNFTARQFPGLYRCFKILTSYSFLFRKT